MLQGYLSIQMVGSCQCKMWQCLQGSVLAGAKVLHFLKSSCQIDSEKTMKYKRNNLWHRIWNVYQRAHWRQQSKSFSYSIDTLTVTRLVLGIMGHQILWKAFQKVKPRRLEMRKKLTNHIWCSSSKSIAIFLLQLGSFSILRTLHIINKHMKSNVLSGLQYFE